MAILKTIIDNFTINTLSNDWCGSTIYKNKSWEPHITRILERNLNPNSVLVDIGSNYGWHSIKNASLCKMVYSFEPQKYIHDIQKMSIKENKISNIKLYNCGIGDKNEIKQMSAIDYNNPSINMGDLSIGVDGEYIEVKTLDSFKIPKIDFIKIDVQGYEKFVLQGSKNTIVTLKPTIIIEMENHQLRKFNYNIFDLFAQLREFEYYIYLLDYFYPSDHICVHKAKLNEFIEINNQYIKPLIETNNLNYNIENGVTKKIIYDQN